MRVEPRSADDLAKMLRCEVGTIHKLRAASQSGISSTGKFGC